MAVTLSPELRQDPESVGDVTVRAADGTAARLSDIADIRLSEGRSMIARDGGQRRQIVTANPTPRRHRRFCHRCARGSGGSGQTAPWRLARLGGVAEGQRAASRQLGVNVAAAAIGIVALLIFAFGGVRAAGPGFSRARIRARGGGNRGRADRRRTIARRARWFRHPVRDRGAQRDPAGCPSRSSRRRRRPAVRPATVLRAAEERVTPILMTALVTALGLVPLALEAGQSGREVQGPMAIVILGGLVTSTAMSLLLLPALVLRYPEARGVIL